jgi:hypothetical protein
MDFQLGHRATGEFGFQELTAGYRMPCVSIAPTVVQHLTDMSRNREGRAMDRSSGLHLVGRITYYMGWAALVCGGLVHLNIARALFTAMSMTKRNLFEVSIACFVICMASEVRALSTAEKDLPTVVNRPVAA